MRIYLRKFLPPVFVSLTVCTAAFTYGGVAVWAQTATGLMAFITAVLCLFLLPQSKPEKTGSPVLKISLSFLGAWIILQSALIRFGYISVPAVNSYSSLYSKLFIWLSYALLARAVHIICRSRTLLRFVTFAIIGIASFEAMLGIASLYTDLGIFSVLVGGGRAVGTFSSGNSFGGFLVISLIITVGVTLTNLLVSIEHISKRGMSILHVSNSSDYKILGTVALVVSTIIQIIAIVISGSRGALIAVLLASSVLVIWFGLRNRNKSTGRYTMLFIVALAAFLAVIGIGGTYAVSVGRFQELSNAHSAALPRLVIWKAVLGMIRSFPFGIGPGSFSSMFTMFQPYGFNLNRVYHAHNDYLELLAELGIPGMVFMVSALIALLAGAVRNLVPLAKGNSIWIRRSALLAAFAALLHAAVDFNLSSRPGVAVLFFVVLGMITSLPLNKKADKVKGYSARAVFKMIAVAAVALPLVVHQLRFAVASVLTERGFAAAGGRTSIYFMLPVPDMSPRDAIAELERAVAVMPRSSHSYVMLGRSRLTVYDRKLQDVVRQALDANPAIPPAVIRNQVAAVMRGDENEVLKLARNDLKSALAIAPDSAEVQAYSALVAGRLAAAADSGEVSDQSLAELMILSGSLVKRVPNDFAINSIVFKALAKGGESAYIESCPELQELAKYTGLRLLRLNSGAVANVLREFYNLKISPKVILNAPDIPLQVIWKIYKYYSNNDDAENSLISLQALASALDEQGAGRRTLLKPSIIVAQQKRYRAKLVLERCRWYLRTKKFFDYMQYAPQRTDVLKSYVDKEINKFAGSSAADLRFRYSALDKLRNGRGIDASHIQECYDMAVDSGKDSITLNSILSPLVLFGADKKDRAEYLKRFTEPVFRHRVELMKIWDAVAMGNYDSAAATLKNLAAENPDDPDIYASVVKNARLLGPDHEIVEKSGLRLKEISPEHYIGMQLMGGRVEFSGVTAEPNHISTFWRFRSPVSSDLYVYLLCRDSKNKTVFSRAVGFTKACPVAFGNGNPKPGIMFKVDFSLTEAVSKSTRLIVGLKSKSTGRFVVSEEGLPYFECYDWFDLLEDRNVFRYRNLPPENVCRAFGIYKDIPKESFSHNLHRIFDNPRFYPLLEGKRRKTDPSTWQPCLSAAGIVEQAASAAEKAFKDNPELLMFPLGINDGQEWCECDACCRLFPRDNRDLPASQRWWSEPYWSFVNKVAEKVMETNPDKRIGAIAYSNVVMPPSFNLQSNITVYVCQDAGGHFDKKDCTRDRKILKDWVDVCSDVGLYNYAGLVSWVFPRYCRDEIASDIRYASELGIERFYIENAWVKGIDGPLPWITQKLIDDPRLDPKKLQQEYCRYLFGTAAETMDLYFDYLQEVWASADSGKWFDGLFKIDEQARRYPPDVRRQMYKYIGIARKSAHGDKSVLKHINQVAAPLRLSEAFAAEYDLMQSLRMPITSMQSLTAAESRLAALQAAINSRNKLIAELPYKSWGKSAMRALSASEMGTTLERWDKKEAELTENIGRNIKVIRNAIQDL